MNERYQLLYKESLSVIQPYMIIVGRKAKSVSSPADRARLENGVSLMLQAIDIFPGSWPGWWIIGKAYQALGDHLQAAGAFGKAYSINSTNPDVCRESMFEYLKLGKGAEAVEAAKTAVSRNPDDAGLIANLALALLIGGDVGEAREVCEAAYRMSPDDKVTRNLRKWIKEVQNGKKVRPTRLA